MSDLLNLNLNSPDYGLMLPQLIVFGLAIVLMLGDAFAPKRTHYNLLTAFSLIGYAGAMVALYWQNDRDRATFSGMFRADGLTVFLSVIILSAAVLSVMVSASYVQNLEGKMPIGEFYVLLAFSVLGGLIVSAAGDLVVIFVGIELSSLATYVLTAFAKRRMTSIEGALKYFLLGIFASAILIYGMAWTYGLSGSTSLLDIHAHIASVVAGTSPPRTGAAARALAAGGRTRIQDRGGAVPHVDAGCLRRRADPGDRLHVGRAEGGRVRGDHPDFGRGPRTAPRRLDQPDRGPRGADDGLR